MSITRLPLAVVLIAALWGLSGIYKVQPDQEGLELRFGRLGSTEGPGVHYHWPLPIGQVLLPSITRVSQLQIGRSTQNRNQMLTGDENIVEADCAVSWRISDAQRFLFKVEDPEGALKMAAESAMREVIGRSPIQAAMSDRRQQIADEIKDLLQRILDSYEIGVQVMQVQLQRVDPPYLVIDAFNDVQRARADQERARNEAEAYRNDILPRARGEAGHIIQEAEAYKTQLLNLTAGEVNSFEALSGTYNQAKDITAWRLYLDAMDEVLHKASKVIVDASGKGAGPVVPYLPLVETRSPQATDTPGGPLGGPMGGKP